MILIRGIDRITDSISDPAGVWLVCKWCGVGTAARDSFVDFVKRAGEQRGIGRTNTVTTAVNVKEEKTKRTLT